MSRTARAPLLRTILAGGLAALAGGCSGSSGGPAEIVTGDEVALADVQAQVFSPRCALSGCHSGPGAPFGLDLSAGASAGSTIDVASAEIPEFARVVPFDPVDSYLYMKLVGDPRILGDPMPLSGGPLTDGDLALLHAWIEQGAMQMTHSCEIGNARSGGLPIATVRTAMQVMMSTAAQRGPRR